MARPEEAVEAERRPDDLLAVILADHAEIKELFADVIHAADMESKEGAFRRLVRKLAVHETAEQEVLRPLTREVPRGEEIVSERLEEESEAEELLAELESMGVDAPDFDAKIRTLRDEVVEHAEQEEDVEHPRVQEHVAAESLERLADLFRVAEKAAPTHAHPSGPESAAGNLALGPFVAIVDRARDALRNARESVTF